ncbi:MAG: porin [Macromonas bipunctata]|nr:porin [Macromonas bipunctata]
MKKTLIALAVLAASGAAMAQSSVSIYGIVDAAIHKDKNDAARLSDGGVDSSRIGFKGTEDLGGGLKAHFVLEQGLEIDTGAAGQIKDSNGNDTSAAFSRETSVGFSGGFGAVKLGRFKSAYEQISGNTYAVFDSVLSPTLVFESGNHTARPNNGIGYTTPSFAGFSAAVTTNLDETKGVSNNVTAFNVVYEGGPFYADLAYQDEGDFTDVQYTRLNGAYTFGAFKLKAGYGNVDRPVKNTDVDEYHIGVDYTLAPNLILSAGFASSEADNETDSSDAFSFGAAYLLSKRTTVYGGYFDADKKAVANRANVPESRFAVGVKHTF